LNPTQRLKQETRPAPFASGLAANCFCHCGSFRSVLVGEHDRDNSLGHRRIGWIGGMVDEGPIVIIDLEKDRFAFNLERPEIVLFVRVV
jgi:hypothetical protein